MGMRIIGRLCAALLIGLFASGCSLNRHSFDNSTLSRTDEKLSGSKVYVYSLLDFRESTFGVRTLGEFEKQIASRFAEVGVTAKVINFQDTEVGSHYSVTNRDAYVPIRKIVEQNRSDEIAFGAKYRVLVMPTSVDSLSTYFVITWSIINTENNRLVWEGTSHVRSDYVWSVDSTYIWDGSGPPDHAKFLLDPFFAELKAKKLAP